VTRAASALQRSVLVLDLKCRECGQSFKTPGELEEHMDRIHLSKKGGAEVAPDPPNESRR
jgi:hypothetical protein